MKLFNEAEARALLQKVIKLSVADECNASLSGGNSGNIRFALNNVSTSGIVSNVGLAVQVAFGKRVGTATINEFDDASLERVVRRAEDLARLAPENEEYMPELGPQVYKPSPTFVQSTADIAPEYRAQVASDSIVPCKADNLIAAGFLIDSADFFAFANSKGNFGYQQSTDVNYTCTVRTSDGHGSGWVTRNVEDVNKFDTKEAIQVAVSKAKGSAGAKALEPGKYTVILEPAAAAGLISFMMFGFDARQADEGRSFLTKKGGGNKLGEKVFDDKVTIMADPWSEDAPAFPWDGENIPRTAHPIIEKGVVKHLEYSRYWAAKQGLPMKAGVGNLLMAGGTKSTAELIKGTAKGILVTRTWYIRLVDPQTVMLTGLTRDGTFYIENGEIKYPIKNFRFNESPVIMLNNVEELGKPERIAGDESNYSMMIPPMKLRDFTFTSLSDAV